MHALSISNIEWINLVAAIVETYFMNSLPLSLRTAAQDLYVKENLDSIVEFRLKKLADKYSHVFSLTEDQWEILLNALILTKLSQITLGSHLSKESIIQLRFLVKLALGMQDSSDSEIESYLQENAKNFASWYANLLRCSK